MINDKFDFYNTVRSDKDEFFTPEYAIEPILEYVHNGATIWCPFDTEDSLFVKVFLRKGFNVIFTHIDNGGDFFNLDAPECDYIISNPPFSLKTQVLERLFNIGKPFAMLLGIVGLFESKKRFDMFSNNKFEIMYLNKRVAYIMDYKTGVVAGSPPFQSVYLCHNMLDSQIVFKNINKK